MGTLKGQNLRIFTWDSTAEKYHVIGMAINCTITENNNTEDASTKDDVGMAAKPTTLSKSWSVQVESLSVADVGAMLTAIKNKTKFQLMWDQTGTSDNQTASGLGWARIGQAYLTDGTFQFDDRTNSQKNLTFTGVGALTTQLSSPTTETVAAGSYTKGQFVRLFLSSDNTAAPVKVIGAAKQLSLHVSLALENNSTKDTPLDWEYQEPTTLSYDITSNALVEGGDTITSSVQAQDLNGIQAIYDAGTPVKWKIANVSGDNQRTAGTVICSGSALIQTLTINAQNRAAATYTTQLVGYGDYTVGS